MRGGAIYAGKPGLQHLEGSEWVWGLLTEGMWRPSWHPFSGPIPTLLFWSLGYRQHKKHRVCPNRRGNCLFPFSFHKLKSSGPTFSFLSVERETSTFYFCYWHLQRRAALLSWGHRGLNREVSQLDNVVGKKKSIPYFLLLVNLFQS